MNSTIFSFNESFSFIIWLLGGINPVFVSLNEQENVQIRSRKEMNVKLVIDHTSWTDYKHE